VRNLGLGSAPLRQGELAPVGLPFPPDTEHNFPAHLKGICTAASEILPEKGPPGSAGGSDPGDGVCFTHVAPRREIRASVGWVGRG
jgi:hypothetical protein